jgi:putative ABC transport system permease protein
MSFLRRRWSIPGLDHFQQDVRYAARGLRRAPGFTITVLLTLGLGIGANAAMFGVIDRLMLRPFPHLRDPDAVHRVYLQTTVNGPATRSVFEYARYLDLRRWTSSFSEYAGFAEWRLAIGPGDAAREQQVAGVNASFFRFFDVQPALGRFFDASEDSVPRGADVGVLSYGFWRSEFAGQDVLGKSLQVGPLVVTIIGVAPEGFVGVSQAEPPAVFLPITTFAYGVNQGDAQTFATRYGWTWMSVMVRRKAGVSAATASADLTRAYIQSRNTQRVQNPRVLPDSIAHPRAVAGALKTAAGPDAGLESKTLIWVSGVAVIVLLIACANVANLMFARVLRRRREIAVRLALGVSRRRLTAQFLTEGLMLALLGCVAGVAFAQWVSGALRQMLIRDGSSAGLVTDWRTLGVALAVALGVGFLTAIGPALLAVRGDLAAILRADSRAGAYQRSRARSALMILQGALSVVLLVGAGLFVRSLANVRSMRLGWDPEPVLIVTPNYRGLQMDSAARDAFRGHLLETAQSIPGVEYAARVNSLPFGTNSFELHVTGIDSVERLGRFNYQATTPDYFKTAGTRIMRGRSFTSSDRRDAPRVVVVSESMGRVLWPGRDPIGQCIRIGRGPVPCTTVIGIAEDAVQNSITETERFMYYLSDEQPPLFPGNRLFLRMAGGNAPAQAERVRRALQRVMPGPAYVTVSPLEDLVDSQRRSWRLGAAMFVAFGVLALIVTAVGLYGVIAFTVAQRMHELGVRIALGAQMGDIVRLVMTQTAWFATAGVATGIAAALFAARWVQPLLFQESARDPLVLSAVSATVGLVAVLASAVPALRATRADPNAALRSD